MNTRTNNKNNSEIVINATKISAEQNTAEIYEFVLNNSLKLIKCKYIESVSQARSCNIEDFMSLKDMLFEINHVRIDPKVDNELILYRFKKALLSSGVKLIAPPDEILMAICYKPIGELTDTVRFYLKPDHSLVFLSKVAKLTVV